MAVTKPPSAKQPSAVVQQPPADNMSRHLVGDPTLVKHGHWFRNEWTFKDGDGKDLPKKEEPPGRSGHEAVPTMADKWHLVDLFLQYKGLVTQHISSYNHFIEHGLHEIMSATSNFEVSSTADPKWFLTYDQIYVGEPSIDESQQTRATTPQMCRIRDLTYSAPILVDVRYWMGDKPKFRRGFEIGRMPIMLRSCKCPLAGRSAKEMEEMGECPYDPGGYFIVGGTERVLLMQEQPLTNRIIVEYDAKKNITAFVQSSTAENKNRTVVCFHTQTTKKGLYMKHSAFEELISVGIVLRAMGVESDMELIQTVGLDKDIYSESLMPSLQEIHEKAIFSQQKALEYLNQRLKFKSNDALEVLNKQVLSHITCRKGDLAPRIRYMGLMIRRVIEAKEDERLIDDRDYYGNKRLELSGQLLSVLFEDQFKTMNQKIKDIADKQLDSWHGQNPHRRVDMSNYPDMLEKIDVSHLTKAMTHSISTGNWNISRFKIQRAGVSQVLSRLSYMASIGAMMRVKSQFAKDRKVAGPRALQPSQWGMLCPVDTPEGEQCGLVKHLSLLTHVTTGESEYSTRQMTSAQSEARLRKTCHCLGVEDAHFLTGEELHQRGNYLVFLNGSLLGVHRRPKQFMSNLKQLRRNGRVGEFVSIYENSRWNAIWIASDAGRLIRPLIIVINGKPRFDPAKHVPLIVKTLKKEDGGMDFADFLKQGIVEWIDVNEENNLFIAMTPEDIVPETTHLEVEPITLLGVVSGLIPYPNHNQSPRNIYECAMGKQAMGAVAMNQYSRTDKDLMGLVYPQKPLVTSKTLNLVKFHHLGAGQNASVAVMSYSGYDIEDAIVMNRASLDRGFGRCFVMRRTSVPMTVHPNGLRDKLAPVEAQDGDGPSARGERRQAKRIYSALGREGLVMPGEKLEDECVIANRVTPVDKETFPLYGNAEPLYQDTAVKYRQPEASYVDRVILSKDTNGQNYKVVTRQTRRPELGDKFASRHGQKGVIGLIVGEEDMPFSESGWRPDLIMNPHGFPSRMTVGKMLECVASKAAVMDGIFGNGSAFTNTPAEEIYKTLIRHGFSHTGKEYLTSGITGEPIESYIFCGPIYYQKLKHMVVDKMHARAKGRTMKLTRQPTEGRAKEGGMRLGEMERDCLVAWGASNLLLERLMYSSDACTPTICKSCGLVSGRPDWCKFCRTGDYVTLVRMPYACKLLIQEMQSMNITCRLQVAAPNEKQKG